MSVTIVRNPDELALRQVAALHCALLPGSAVSRFGASFAHAFYRYTGRSPKEVVFAAIDAGTVVAAAVVSLRPQDLQRRLLLHTPLLPQMVIHPLTAFGVVRERLAQRFEGDIDQNLPEVIAIFTATEHQGRGIGTQLLRTIEKDLSARGLSRYGLRTEDVTGNRAIGFYDKQGFVVVGHARTPHARFRVMTKHIGAIKM